MSLEKEIDSSHRGFRIKSIKEIDTTSLDRKIEKRGRHVTADSFQSNKPFMENDLLDWTSRDDTREKQKALK